MTLSNKKPKFGPKIATKEWWIQRIKDTPGPKYTELWTHIPKYQLARFKALAEIDYNFLGKELEGRSKEAQLPSQGTLPTSLVP